MSGRYTYRKRYKYPHMLSDDVVVWERFMTKYPERFDTVDYDWRVGEGMELLNGWDDNFKRMVTMITQKRIDVLAWNAETPTIIEVKRRVTIGTLGQVLGYQVLFINEFPNIIKPEMMVVCEVISKDDITILTEFNITIEVV